MSAIERSAYLLEVGIEEIPARMAVSSVQQLAGLLVKELKAVRLEPGLAASFVTPRRLVVMLRDLPVRQEDIVVEKRGPARRIAQDAEGNWTKAGMGFARGQGLDVEQLTFIEHNGDEYIFARKQVQGEEAVTLLPPILERVLAALRFPKSMRWGQGEQAFVRPVHWLLSLLDETVVPFRYAGIDAGNTTMGHRFMGSGAPVTIPHPDRFADILEQEGVLLDPARRRARIQEGIGSLENETGLKVIVDEGLLEEVTHLVEFPVVNSGSFAEKFLAMPPEVLITSMKNHQKFFAVEEGGNLTNRFVVVNNTAAREPAVVVRGNERVLTARLEDAFFFFKEDRKRALQDYVEGLGGQTFLKGLGSMRDKAERAGALARVIGGRLFGEQVADVAARAGTLCKADLATQMVFEFPELQGIMGREYGKASGESEAVATAIFEHYLPRFATDDLPQSDAGAALALADRLDTVVGCYHLGLIPTATKDPYALRRAVLAILRILMDRRSTVGLAELVQAALDNYGDIVQDGAKIHAAVMEFIEARLRHTLADSHATEVVDACMAAGFDVPYDVLAKCRAVEPLRGRPDYEDLIHPFKRVINITRKEESGEFHAQAMVDDAEKALWKAFSASRVAANKALEERRFADVLELFVELKPAIDRYFDDVLVMCDDEALRTNHLAMLGEIGRLFLRFADFTRILA